MAAMEQRRLELPGGREVVVRAMDASDAAGLRALYGRLGEEDLYKRFFTGRPPPDEFIEKMASIGQRDGFGVVAVATSPGGEARIIAEASFVALPDGNAELGITVEQSARGWLGPYMLDLLVEEAALRRIPNLEAEVLATNRQMPALLEARGSAVLDHSDRPAIVRLCIGTRGRSPAWTGPPDRPRLLVEIPGGRWRGMDAAREAGFEVPGVPVCLDSTRPEPGGGEPADELGDAVVARIHPGMDEQAILGLLRRVARRRGAPAPVVRAS